MQDTWILRPGNREDGPGLIALIDAVYREYGVEVDAGDKDVDVDVVDNLCGSDDVAGVNLHMQTFFAGEHLSSKIP